MMFCDHKLSRDAARKALARHSLFETPIFSILYLDLIIHIRPPHPGLSLLTRYAHLLEAAFLRESKQEKDRLIVL